MRTNVYREKILSLLKEKQHHLLSLREIHEALSEADYSTIFRNVEQLHKLGHIRKVVLDDTSVAYEIGGDRHDHFVCTSCGTVTVLTNTLEVKKYTDAPVIHDVTVRGICKSCTS